MFLFIFFSILPLVITQGVFSFTGQQSTPSTVQGVPNGFGVNDKQSFDGTKETIGLDKNGSPIFPNNCEGPFWQRFRHGGGPFGWAANASTETRNGMRQIMFNHELSRQQKEVQIEQLVAKESPEVQAAYMKHKQERIEEQTKMQLKHDQLVQKLSPQAQAAELMLTQVYKKEGASWSEKQAETKKIMDSLNDSVKTELNAMRDELRKDMPWTQHGRWGGRGGWGGWGRHGGRGGWGRGSWGNQNNMGSNFNDNDGSNFGSQMGNGNGFGGFNNQGNNGFGNDGSL